MAWAPVDVLSSLGAIHTKFRPFSALHIFFFRVAVCSFSHKSVGLFSHPVVTRQWMLEMTGTFQCCACFPVAKDASEVMPTNVKVKRLNILGKRKTNKVPFFSTSLETM